jgi:hypothetical protein
MELLKGWKISFTSNKILQLSHSLFELPSLFHVEESFYY